MAGYATINKCVDLQAALLGFGLSPASQRSKAQFDLSDLATRVATGWCKQNGFWPTWIDPQQPANETDGLLFGLLGIDGCNPGLAFRTRPQKSGQVRFAHRKCPPKTKNFQVHQCQIKQQSIKATNPIHQTGEAGGIWSAGAVWWMQNERHPPEAFLVDPVAKSNSPSVFPLRQIANANTNANVEPRSRWELTTWRLIHLPHTCKNCNLNCNSDYNFLSQVSRNWSFSPRCWCNRHKANANTTQQHWRHQNKCKISSNVRTFQIPQTILSKLAT